MCNLVYSTSGCTLLTVTTRCENAECVRNENMSMPHYSAYKLMANKTLRVTTDTPSTVLHLLRIGKLVSITDLGKVCTPYLRSASPDVATPTQPTQYPSLNSTRLTPRYPRPISAFGNLGIVCMYLVSSQDALRNYQSLLSMLSPTI
jgi:hypothetical protein